MTIREVVQLLKAVVHTGEHLLELNVQSACSADLMSDVMAFSKENAMLLTGLVNPQVIRTAEMLDIRAVIFVRGKKPQEAMVQLAGEKDIILISTNDSLFVASGKLYEKGINGYGEQR